MSNTVLDWLTVNKQQINNMDYRPTPVLAGSTSTRIAASLDLI